MTQAVFWGVNIYQNFDDATLRGCVPDSNRYRIKAHNDWGVASKDIVVLHDSQATEKAVKEALLDMVRSQTGGPKHLFAAGSVHGSNNPAPTYIQADGLEEIVCLYDLQERNGLWVSGFLSAGWIGDLFSQVRAIDTLDFFLDCCNAPKGDQLKKLALTYDKARFLPRTSVGPPVVAKSIAQIKGTVPPNVTLWSACEPQQTSADTSRDGEWGGAFTFEFLENADRKRNRGDIIYYTRRGLISDKYKQIPHLYCHPAMAMAVMG